MQVEMWHVFLEFSIMLESNYQFYWIPIPASYIQTDGSFQVRYCRHSCQPESEFRKYVLQDILSFESPLLPTSLLKLCSQIIWLDYTGSV